jgi:hypothetical protein
VIAILASVPRFVLARGAQAIQNLGHHFESRASDAGTLALIALPRGFATHANARRTIVEIGHTEDKFVFKVLNHSREAQ